MSVFICWSGARSHKLAVAVEALLQKTLRLEKGDVFVSDRIEKGVEWFGAIVEHLETSKVGIVCLTVENFQNPWLHFESGALALRLERDRRREEDERTSAKTLITRNRLFTLLHGVTGAELKGPLGSYQATNTTKPDMEAMIESIAEILGRRHFETITIRNQKTQKHPSNAGVPSGHQPGQASPMQSFIGDSAWEPFEKALDELAIPVRDLIQELDSWFQRKTFKEPLYRCADQAWLRRYDGARQTHDRLSAYIDKVRAACPEHESDLFEMLVSEVDGYEMALAALLLTPKTFLLGDRGELKMDSSIQTSCEDRRLAIRSLAGRLLNSVDNPLQGKEAVRFMGAETDEERKMIVHRLESAIRSKWEEVHQKSSPHADTLRRAIAELTNDRRPIDFRASSWDLDRIFYYLLIEYFRAAGLRWMPVQIISGSAPAISASQPAVPVSDVGKSDVGNPNPIPQTLCARRVMSKSKSNVIEPNQREPHSRL